MGDTALPSGPYHDSCNSCKVNNGELSCLCTPLTRTRTHVQVNDCVSGSIYNRYGSLACKLNEAGREKKIKGLELQCSKSNGHFDVDSMVCMCPNGETAGTGTTCDWSQQYTSAQLESICKQKGGEWAKKSGWPWQGHEKDTLMWGCYPTAAYPCRKSKQLEQGWNFCWNFNPEQETRTRGK